MQTGEVLRRVVFNLLDAAKGGRLKKLKEVNKREIVVPVSKYPFRCADRQRDCTAWIS